LQHKFQDGEKPYFKFSLGNLGDPTNRQKAGRPGNPVSQEAFVKVAEYLKSNDEGQMLLISLTKWESSCKALD